MENITVSGDLTFGYNDDEGTIHRAFTMRPLTLGDMERMEEEHPELWGRGGLVMRRLVFACELESLGTLQKADITPELLAGLPLQDFEALAKAEEELTKKLRAAYGRGGEDAS